MGLLSQEERSIVSRPPQFPVEGKLRIVLSVTDNEPAFKGAAFGSLKYEHLYRIEIYTDPSLRPQPPRSAV